MMSNKPAMLPLNDTSENPEGSTSTDHEENDNEKASSQSTSTDRNHHNSLIKKKDAERRGKQFIEQEEKRVWRVRYTLASTILVLSVVVSTCVYIFATRSEMNSFDNEFLISSDSVVANVQWENNYNFALLEEVSSIITSNAITTEATFPNVTVPHFEIQAGYANGLGGMIACTFVPFIQDEERLQWEEYAMLNHNIWLSESKMLRDTHHGHQEPLKGTKDDEDVHETAFQGNHGVEAELHDGYSAYTGKMNYSTSIYNWVNGTIAPMEEHVSSLYAPIWQVTPPVPMAVNSDLFSSTVFVNLYQAMIQSNQTVLSTPGPVGQIFDFLFDLDHVVKKLEPYSFIATPVYETFEEPGSHTLVGMVVGLSPFDNLFDFILTDKTKGLICVVSDDCGNIMSYEINGPNVTFLGYEDAHDPNYNEYEQSATLEVNKIQLEDECTVKIHLYPSEKLESSYKTSKPIIYASIVALSFLVTSILIVVYDVTVTRRQEKTMKSALRNGALIESLFPANVRDRLLNDAQSNIDMENVDDDQNAIDNKGRTERARARPIADFFPNVTLMFADIAGFTAWSSTREPFQVFELLETIYGEFDKIAKRRGIFKVETVGDCYVAASGIPDFRDDHAVAMAKFARECLLKIRQLLKILEVTLGPDTSGLAFRVGLHSGPVTGGVLRGDNARFQLFGDTMNTTARMESTGLPNRIQISQTTANLLIDASKENWIKERDEVVHAKGKGEMKTYWLNVDEPSSVRRSTSSQSSERLDLASLSPIENERIKLDEKTQRLADWNTEMMLRFLKLIVARRNASENDLDVLCEVDNAWEDIVSSNVNVIDEVAEIISLPTFTTPPPSNDEIERIFISPEAEKQLHAYVEAIALMYRKNPFHNFEHANHVCMSVVKLMNRIAPMYHSTTSTTSSHELHDHTYGITSDPLTQFACLFAALIHDVDHCGVPNAQLVREQDPMAQQFHGKSVLEQNSVVVAWDLLMEQRFQDLRNTICTDHSEVKRFRQLVVNAVMATDIMEADLKAVRNGRWNKAFSDYPMNVQEDPMITINRKATIVIDHMIQASDVCHAMQHWHIFRKWNERLFIEMSNAYYDGRSDTNPADVWYKGEIGFFDYYIIPLAKKLNDCGVFGVSSDEYLNYAIQNRNEWEIRGEDIVHEMAEKFLQDRIEKQ